jgi:hypothetical protein
VCLSKYCILYTRDLSIHGFRCLRMVLDPVTSDAGENCTCLHFALCPNTTLLVGPVNPAVGVALRWYPILGSHKTEQEASCMCIFILLEMFLQGQFQEATFLVRSCFYSTAG